MMARRWKIGRPFVLAMIIVMLLSSAPCPATAKHVSRLSTAFVTSTSNTDQRRGSNSDDRMGMAAASQTISPSLDSQSGTVDDKDHDRIHNIMSVVRAQHMTDVSLSLQTKLLPEQPQQQSDIDIDDGSADGSRRTKMSYEWRNRETSILETLDAVLDEASRHTILRAAADYWTQQEKEQTAANDTDTDTDTAASTTSRFTLQSPNKREVHASDLNAPAIQALNHALSKCIFPLLRDAYAGDIQGETEASNDEDDDSMLLLYDALIIEYDATSLEGSDLRERPSQPLHRDLGVLSVNIALDDPAQFQGGGTVFEKLLLSPSLSSSSSDDDEDNDISTILPRAAGHAVVHPSRERHAGGALISGRRTILVMFVTATHRDSDRRIQEGTMPHPLEAAARCKILGMKLSQPDAQAKVPDSSAPPLQGKQDQIMCYRTAVQYDPSDGEAWLYLAMALQSDTSSSDGGGTTKLNEATECLKTARQLSPNDGRVHNTLGIALQQRFRTNIPASETEERLLLQNEIMKSFCTAAKLHSRAAAAGCQGAAAEARSALLNWGLYHANRDEFEKAVHILRQVCLEGHVADTSVDDDTALHQQKELDMREQEARRIVRDAKSLLSFCEKQHAADTSNNQTDTESPASDDDDNSSSFIVRLASDERDHVHVEALTDIINAAYKVGEKGIIVDSNEHPFHRVTVDDVQKFMRDGKLLILTTTATSSKEEQEAVLGCVKVEAFHVQDPDDPLLGQNICEWGCFAVAPAVQLQGHGRRLVQAVEDYSRNELNCTWLQLELLTPTHERHAHKDMLREWYTTRLGYQLKWASDYEKSTVRYPKGELLLGVVRLATDADFATYRKQL